MSEIEYLAMDRLIRKCVREYGRGMDQEECRADAWRVLLEAKMTFPDVAGCCNFASYAQFNIKEYLDEARKKRNRRIAIESPFSLDVQYYETNECMRDRLTGKVNDCFNYVALWDFVESLGSEKHMIARMMDHGMVDGEIMTQCHLDARTYYGILEELQKDFDQWQRI